MTLAKRYHKKYWPGGSVNSPESMKMAGGIGQGAGMAASMIDAFSPADQYGKRSGFANIGGGALKGAATGAQFGPLGAGVGAAVGLVSGAIVNGKQKEEANRLKGIERINGMQRTQAMTAARVSSDPSSVYGNLSSGYYAAGGYLTTEDPPEDDRKRFKNRKGLNNTLNHNYGFSGIIDDKGRNIDNPTENEAIKTMLQFMNHNWDVNAPSPSNNYRPVWQHQTFDPNKAATDNLMTYAAVGGSLATGYKNMVHQPMENGNATALNSTAAEFKGPSHEQGGIQLPGMQAEVEGNETTNGDYVYSDRLGFAALHKPIAKAIGKIEKKALTPERITSIKLLKEKENQLKLSQEYTKHMLGLN